MQSSSDSTSSQASENTASESGNPATSEPIIQEPLDAPLLDWQALTPESLQPALDLLKAYPALGAVAVVVLGVLFGLLARAVVVKGLGRLAKKSESTLDDRLIAILTRPVFNGVFLLSLMLAVEILLGDSGAAGILQKLLASLLVVVLMTTALRSAGVVLEAMGRSKRFNVFEPRTIPLFDIIAKLVIVGAGVYFIFILWGINPAAWIASAGVVGIAVGFAARDTLANLFSGFFIVADAPYKIGDYIVLDSGERGVVTDVGMRSTRILTRDDVEVTVPNSVIGGGKIVNESGGPWEKFRIRIGVGVAYGSDVDQVVEVLMSVVKGHERVCTSPEPRVRMRGLGDSSLDFELLCWVERPEQRGLVTHQLYMAVYKALNSADIEIPFPQRDLHVRSSVVSGSAEGLE